MCMPLDHIQSCSSRSGIIPPFMFLLFVPVTEYLRSHANKPNDARHHHKMQEHPASAVVPFETNTALHSSSSPQYVLIHAIMGFLMPPVVKMWHFVPLLLLPWSETASKVSIALARCFLALLSFCMGVVIGIFGPLSTMLTISARLVETRRRATECGALLVQSAGGPRPECR
jgi:hypothetical protein